MRNLIDFIVKYNHWLLFVLLEVLSLWLLFRFNTYQGSVFFTSANRVVGSVYEWTSSVRSYVGLRSANEKLLDRNLSLVLENERLRAALDSIGTMAQPFPADTAVEVIAARVVNNSVNRLDNYITIDKGSNDGIREDMGVVGPEGAVGIVCMTSARHALVISVLNSRSNISCKLARSEYFGNLCWDGGDPQLAQLIDVPRHAEVNAGDTVVTSGYSSVFPEGIMVGTVARHGFSEDGLTCVIDVKLSTDIARLGMVRVIGNSLSADEDSLTAGIKSSEP